MVLPTIHHNSYNPSQSHYSSYLIDTIDPPQQQYSLFFKIKGKYYYAQGTKGVPPIYKSSNTVLQTTHINLYILLDQEHFQMLPTAQKQHLLKTFPMNKVYLVYRQVTLI